MGRKCKKDGWQLEFQAAVSSEAHFRKELDWTSWRLKIPLVSSGHDVDIEPVWPRSCKSGEKSCLPTAVAHGISWALHIPPVVGALAPASGSLYILLILQEMSPGTHGHGPISHCGFLLLTLLMILSCSPCGLHSRWCLLRSGGI